MSNASFAWPDYVRVGGGRAFVHAAQQRRELGRAGHGREEKLDARERLQALQRDAVGLDHVEAAAGAGGRDLLGDGVQAVEGAREAEEVVAWDRKGKA